jgi:CheY-like chemotaxis protein/DnaJ-domain-containing protein 1
MKDYYDILEVLRTATQEEIREQYYFLIQAWHPDKFRSPKQKAKAEEKSKEINIAYGVLKDIAKRAEYDSKLSGQASRYVKPERRRPTEEHPRSKQAKEEQQRPGYTQQQAERPEREPRHTNNEADASALEEWIRFFFEQARRRQSKQPPANLNKSHPASIRVLVVDDAADTRMIIRKLLSSETDIKVVGEASDGVEAVEKFSSLKPDVTTICINATAMGGITATEAIRRKHPLAKVIMISVQNSTSYIRRAMLSGACDYLTNPPRAEELRSAIRLAAEQ